MESRLFEDRSGASPVPVYIASEGPGYEQISLVDLLRVISRRKWIPVTSLLVSLLLVLVYLFHTRPVYTASCQLMPPRQQDIRGLLVDYRASADEGDDRYTPELVYKLFLNNLKSHSLRRAFFDQNNLVNNYVAAGSEENINVDEVFDNMFNSKLRVEVEKDDEAFVTVSFSYTEPAASARLLNELIDFANKRTVRQLVDNVNADIQGQIAAVSYRLDGMLKLAEQKRKDTVVTLKEALRIARELGIRDAINVPKVSGEASYGLSINTAQLPLYMRGSDALETEISVLESRKSDEPFISGFRDLRLRLARLESISIDPDSLSAVTVDAVATTPYRAERPRVMLLVIIAAALGLIIGVLLVFVTEFLSKAYGKPVEGETC